MEDIELWQGDCMELMKKIPDSSVDMILCDPPYGVLNKTNKNARWDSVIPFDALWKQVNRVIKPNGAVIMFASGMFTAKLMLSNEKMWRYNLIWDKKTVSGFLNANRMPLRCHEDICVFYKKLPTYNPQMIKRSPENKAHSRGNPRRDLQNNCYGTFYQSANVITDEKFPTSIVGCPREHCNGKFFHPTQKPVGLLEWLIKTYTNEGETIFDFTMGSGSTGVACVNTGRKFVGIELEPDYFRIAKQRIEEAQKNKKDKSQQISLFE